MKSTAYKYIKYLIIHFNMIKLFNSNLALASGLYFLSENELYMHRPMLKAYLDLLELLWDRPLLVQSYA